MSAAHTVGAEPIAKQLIDFMNGSALSFRMRSFISGIDVETTVRTAQGIELTRPPYSTTELDQLHPDLSQMFPSSGMVQCLMLSVDCQASPVFYRPNIDEKTNKVTIFNPNLTMPDLMLNRSLGEFCESLSLACNTAVDWFVKWRDLGESNVFVAPRVNYEINTWSYRKPVNLVQKDWDTTQDIHHARFSCEQQNRFLELALRRWIRSMKAHNDEDKLIELRISLEAIYELSDSTEKSLRIALYCAWHLGDDFSQRQHIFNTIKQFYKDASNVVHAGQPKCIGKNLVSDVQDICREGILKRLTEVVRPNWQELYLGKTV